MFSCSAIHTVTFPICSIALKREFTRLRHENGTWFDLFHSLLQLNAYTWLSMELWWVEWRHFKFNLGSNLKQFAVWLCDKGLGNVFVWIILQLFRFMKNKSGQFGVCRAFPCRSHMARRSLCAYFTSLCFIVRFVFSSHNQHWSDRRSTSSFVLSNDDSNCWQNKHGFVV